MTSLDRELVMLTSEEIRAAVMPWRDLGYAFRALQQKLAEKNGFRLVEKKS